MRKLNKDQRFILSEFYIGLAVAWLSISVISPLFVPIESVVKLILQLGIAIFIAAILVFFALFNLKTKRGK